MIIIPSCYMSIMLFYFDPDLTSMMDRSAFLTHLNFVSVRKLMVLLMFLCCPLTTARKFSSWLSHTRLIIFGW